MAPRDLGVQPLRIGEVIDRALAIYRRHFKVLFPLTLLLESPLYAVSQVYLASLSDLSSVEALQNPDQAAQLATRLGIVSGVIIVVSAFAYFIIAAAIAGAVAPAMIGGEPSFGKALASLARRLPAILSGALFQFLAYLVASVLAILPLGAAAVLMLLWRMPVLALLCYLGAVGCMLLAMLWVFVRYSLSASAAGVEGRPAWRALTRSSWLMRSKPGTPFVQWPSVRASILLLGSLAITFAIQSLVGLPRLIAQLATGQSFLHPKPFGFPLPLQIFLMAFEACGAAALHPIGVLTIVVFYFDRRARREGLDLELWADRLAQGGAVMETTALPAPGGGNPA